TTRRNPRKNAVSKKYTRKSSTEWVLEFAAKSPIAGARPMSAAHHTSTRRRRSTTLYIAIMKASAPEESVSMASSPVRLRAITTAVAANWLGSTANELL